MPSPPATRSGRCALVRNLPVAPTASHRLSPPLTSSHLLSPPLTSSHRLSPSLLAAVGRLFSQRLAQGYNKWVEHAEEGLRKHERVQEAFRQAAARLLSAKLAAACFQWHKTAKDAKAAALLLDIAADGLIPGKAAFTHWATIALEGARTRRALMAAAAAWAGGLRGRWIAWMDFSELRRGKMARVKQALGVITGRETAQLARAFEKLLIHCSDQNKLRRMVRRHGSHRARPLHIVRARTLLLIGRVPPSARAVCPLWYRCCDGPI